MQNLLVNERFERLYNCSFYDYESVPREMRKKGLAGTVLLLLYGTFELLYLPCLMVFSRKENIRESCYRLMLFMGILSMINIHSSGLVVGVYAIRGDVFCDRPLFNYLIGMPAFVLCLYCAESLTAVILALNRCVEMWDNGLARTLFAGSRLNYWMVGTLLYGFVLGAFTIPPVPNGMLVGWFFNPHIAYMEDSEGIYHNKLFTMHNLSIGIGLPLLYFVFYLLMRSKMNMVGSAATAATAAGRGGGRGGDEARRRAAERHKSKANVFIQVMLVGVVHMFCTLLYVYMQYFPVPIWVVMSASYAWIASQGLVPVIYITLNKYIRRSIKMFLVDPTLSQMNAMRIYTTQVSSMTNQNLGRSQLME